MQMDSSGALFCSLVFGSIGMGYFIYGKRQRRSMAFFSGILLCAYPYFIGNILLMILIGLALMALPFVVKS